MAILVVLTHGALRLIIYVYMHYFKFNEHHIVYGRAS